MYTCTDLLYNILINFILCIMKKDFDITKTKLIIWDLDDTFWEGTLSEGNVNFNKDTLLLIEELTNKGIMNSICSKNDFLNAKAEFLKQGFYKYWQLFVFPSVNWNAKGQRVKNIISSMQLREENVIVIDDNESNINEIKFYCPHIMSAVPEQINRIAQELYLVNDYDFEHIRLEQYKILEKKNKDKLLSDSSNEEFLKSSNIKLCIKHDCMNNIDRIQKLILRTNQLNFTKNRIDSDILKSIFDQTGKYESGYIIAEDKYGSYGICGFYALNKENNSLEHFLFSCRIMNMGIEQFVYKHLGFPDIKIKYPVSSKLDTPVNWITLTDNLEIKRKKEKEQNGLNILFKGACDLYSTINYIEGNCNIDTEFPYWNKKLLYISSHTHPAFIEQTHKLSQDELLSLCLKFPNPHPDEYNTEFFNPKYNVIVLSILQSAYRGVYINKQNGHYAVYGYTNCDITDKKNWDKVLSSIPEEQKEQNKEILEEFSNDYIFAGCPPVDLTIKNLKYIREHLAPTTSLILILGSEIDTDKCFDGYEGMCEQHIKLNKAVREFAKSYKNIDLLEITKLIQNDDDYADCINHFSRRIYAEMAREIIDMVNSKLGEKHLFYKNESNKTENNPEPLLV